jgi:hypothetical protein
LNCRALGFKMRNMAAVLNLRLRNNASRLSVTLCDQLVSLKNTFAHVFLVQAACKLKDVVGVLAIGATRRGHESHRTAGSTTSLQFCDAGVAGSDFLDKPFVFRGKTTHFDDNLVQEIVDFVD